MTRVPALFLAAALTAPLGLASLAAHAASPPGVSADDSAPKGDIARGKKLFFDVGCYQCHGFEGVTGGPGGRLAPDPLNYEAVMAQLRHPRSRMPIYTAKVMSDQDVADVYAYLKAQPPVKTVASIPLLNQ